MLSSELWFALSYLEVGARTSILGDAFIYSSPHHQIIASLYTQTSLEIDIMEWSVVQTMFKEREKVEMKEC